MFGAELAQRQGRPFSLPLHTNTSQGLDPLGGLRVNISGPECSDGGQWPWKNASLGKASAHGLASRCWTCGSWDRRKTTGQKPTATAKERQISMGISLKTSRNNWRYSEGNEFLPVKWDGDPHHKNWNIKRM